MKGCLKFVGIMFAGFILLVLIAGVFSSGSRSERSASSQAVSRSSAAAGERPAGEQPAGKPEVNALFQTICATDPDWTEVQTEQHLASFGGQEISGWNGYVYEVAERFGDYVVSVAMDAPGLFWSRDIEIEGVPVELAVVLQKEQPITFSGTIARVDRSFGTNCNPIVVKDATFAGIEAAAAPVAETGDGAASDSAVAEATYRSICKTDPDWTEVQTQAYLASFAGREITDWEGWVYEVSELSGQYTLMVAMEEPGLLWARHVEIPGIPADLAAALQKEQPVRFSGRIERVDRTFGANCNPIVVQEATLAGLAAADAAAASSVPNPALAPATFRGICKTDPDWTEVQTQAYLAGFVGREISDWEGWVYEVSELGGQYTLMVAMEPPALLWARHVEIPGLPAELAMALQKEQPVRFSGRLSRVDRTFGTNCNPIVVQDAVVTVE